MPPCTSVDRPLESMIWKYRNRGGFDRPSDRNCTSTAAILGRADGRSGAAKNTKRKPGWSLNFSIGFISILGISLQLEHMLASSS